MTDTTNYSWPHIPTQAREAIALSNANLDSIDADLAAVAATIPAITTGTSAPATTPTAVGRVYVNTTAKTFYVSVGTASSADWKQVPLGAAILALAALTGAANKIPYFTGASAAALLDFKDEDNMASDSATALASQQSIKAYVDSQIGLVSGGTPVYAVLDKDLASPPASPTLGDKYIVGGSATGDWSGHDDDIATATGASPAWDFVTPTEGTYADVADEDQLYRYSGSAWATYTPPADPDALLADTPDELTAGFSAAPYDAGTKTTGTFTPDQDNGNFQYAVNGGAHALAPPTDNCTMVIQYTNNGSAGAITTSGFTRVVGSFTTTNGDDFFCFITKCNGFSLLSIEPLQ